jgi:lysozyme
MTKKITLNLSGSPEDYEIVNMGVLSYKITSISPVGIELIKEFEGFSAKAYYCPGGKLTIGYGHVLYEGENYDQLPFGITEEYATKLLEQDVYIVEKNLNEKVKVKLSHNQYDALCSLVYNVGIGAFNRSKGLKLLNEGQKYLAASEFFHPEYGFVRIKGKVSVGLIRRRQAEWNLFNNTSV